MLRVAGICRRVSSSVVSPVAKTLVRVATAMAVLAAVCLPASAQTTASFAGSLKTVSSAFNDPLGVATDASGNIFVADTGNGAVKEILAAGGYTTVQQIAVANGNFNSPASVAVDASGNVYVADLNGNTIKEIIAAGGYTTVNTLVPQNVFQRPRAIAIDASGNLFVADFETYLVSELLVSENFSTPHTLAAVNGNFEHPSSLAVDASGNVFVADSNNSQIKEIEYAGGYTTVDILAPGFGHFHHPFGLTLDASGNLYVTESGSLAIRKILAAGGYNSVSTVLNNLAPYGIAMDKLGHIFITDAGASVLELQLGPVDLGSVSVKASGTQSLSFTITAGGTIDTVPSVLTLGAAGGEFTDAGTGTCTTNGTSHVYAVNDTCTVDVKFSPLYPGVKNGSVVLTSGGTPIATALIYGTGVGPMITFGIQPAYITYSSGGTLNVPAGIAVDGVGNLYVADKNNNRVLRIAAGDTNCSVASNCTSIGAGLSTSLHAPTGVAVDGLGNVYIADPINDRVVKVPFYDLTCSTASHCTKVGGSLLSPYGVALGPNGSILIANTGDNHILMVPASDQTCSVAGDCTVYGGSTLSSPRGAGMDGAGNLFVADTGSGKIIKIPSTDPQCLLGTCVVVRSSVNLANGIAVSNVGEVYYTDYNGNYLWKSFLQGTNYTQISLTSPDWQHPFGLALRDNGTLYLADSGHNRIAAADLTGAPSIAFPDTQVGTSTGQYGLYLFNSGNATLHFPIPAAGHDPVIPPGFIMGAGGFCPIPSSTDTVVATLDSAQYCNFIFYFAPTSVGSFGGGVTDLDDNLNAPAPNYATQTFVLSGSGVGTPTTTALALNPASNVIPGQSVTLTATVSPTAATGTVSFYDGVTLLNASASTLSSGAVAYTVTNIAAGSHSFTATYNGAATYSTSTSSAQALSVVAPTTAQPVAVSTSIGETSVGGPSVSQTVSFTIGTAGTLLAPQVLTLGSPNLDFTLDAPNTCIGAQTAGATCSVTVNFAPRTAGLRKGAVNLVDVSGLIVATAYVQGTGDAPIAVFTAPIDSTYISGVNGPRAIVFDGAGNAYVGESGTPSVWKYPVGGGARIAIGSGWGDPNGLAIDGAGNLYVADFYTGLYKVTPAGVKTAIGIHHQVQPAGVAVDATGNVIWVNGAGDRNLYKLDTSGTETKLGDYYNSAGQITLDPAGNIYVAQGFSVWKVPAAGTVGTGTEIFHDPFGNFVESVDIDPAGNLYIAENNNHILEVPADGSVSYVVLDGPTYNTWGVRWLDGDLYASDLGGQAIRKLSRSAAASITFPTTAVNATSASKTVSLENDGNSNLHIPPPSTGSNPSVSTGFILSTTCPTAVAGGSVQPLGAGHRCTDTISFSPVVPNATTTGAVVHTSDSRNSITSASISLSGLSTGVATSVSLGVSPSNSIIVGTGGVTLTANVTPTNAPGTVTFYDGASAISGAITPTAGVATFVYSNPVAGSHSLTAVFAGGSGYVNSTSAIQTLAVNKLTQAITFPQPPSQVGGSTYTLNATSNSGLPITYTVTSGPATITGSTVFYTGHGTVVIAADQAGSATYSAAATVSDTITVTPPAFAYTAVSTNVGSTSPTQTGYVTFTNAGTLSSITASSQYAADFQIVPGGTCAVGTAYTVDQNCSYNYTFTPAVAGTRVGGVTLATSGGATLAFGYLNGTGLGAVFAFTNATSSPFGTSLPSAAGISTDGLGNIYTTDPASNVVSKITPAGVVSTFYTGAEPYDVSAVDGFGNVYLSSPNGWARKISSTGVLLGSLRVSPGTALALDSNGTAYVLNQAAAQLPQIVWWDAHRGNSLVSTTGMPMSGSYGGLAIDAGNNFYLADPNNHLIYKIPAAGGAASVLSVSGTALTSPSRMTFDAAGDMYVTELDGTVLRITPDGVSTALSATVTAGSVQANVAINGKGQVYVADPTAKTITTVNLGSIAQQQFPKTVVGQSSPQQVTTVLNTGSANLTFSSLTPVTDWNFGGAGTTWLQRGTRHDVRPRHRLRTHRHRNAD